ncbi:hypothetical protein [Dyella terrae]|nr:hypothetical protein [Dyella terrae]TBR36482.1 hypothetical protein EYV96_11090 [Dyella terrae]
MGSVATTLLAMSLGVAASDAPVAWKDYSLTPVETLSALPATVRQRLRGDASGVGGIAERGAPFNATDIIMSRDPMRRFIVAGHDGHVWVVALEHGGFAYRKVAHVLKPDGTHREYLLAGKIDSLKDVVDQMKGEGDAAPFDTPYR